MEPTTTPIVEAKTAAALVAEILDLEATRSTLDRMEREARKQKDRLTKQLKDEHPSLFLEQFLALDGNQIKHLCEIDSVTGELKAVKVADIKELE